MNDTTKIALLGSLLSKKYARDLLRLLKVYQDISSSEAASRLNLHVQTVQEFLEGLVEAPGGEPAIERSIHHVDEFRRTDHLARRWHNAGTGQELRGNTVQFTVFLDQIEDLLP